MSIWKDSYSILANVPLSHKKRALSPMLQESESHTRKRRIDARLTASSPPWTIIPYQDGLDTACLHRVAVPFAFVDRLPHSILANTFYGARVPQDPIAQPAKMLLVRIADQRSMSKRGMPHAR